MENILLSMFSISSVAFAIADSEFSISFLAFAFAVRAIVIALLAFACAEFSASNHVCISPFIFCMLFCRVTYLSSIDESVGIRVGVLVANALCTM